MLTGQRFAQASTSEHERTVTNQERPQCVWKQHSSLLKYCTAVERQRFTSVSSHDIPVAFLLSADTSYRVGLLFYRCCEEEKSPQGKDYPTIVVKWMWETLIGRQLLFS